jgi:DNA polymerase-3 subunit delta
LWGYDDYSIRQALDEIKKSLGDQAMLAVNTVTLDGQQASPEELSVICETVPFLAEKRLVIINGLLSRFEPRGRRQKQERRGVIKSDEYKSLGVYISKIPESTVLVLIEGRITSSNPLYRDIAGKAVVKSFPLLKENRLKDWIQRHVKENSGSISPGAVELLAKLVGSNLWVMTNEIDKLTSFASERQIELADVKAIVSYVQQADVFDMVDAIVESKADTAEQLLQHLMRHGATPSYLLYMLTRQFRMIVRSHELKAQGKPRDEIQNRLGLFSEFVLDRTLEQARRYSLARLKEVYRYLLETDLSIKTGRYDGEFALDILVAELCRQGTAVVRSGRGG